MENLISDQNTLFIAAHVNFFCDIAAQPNIIKLEPHTNNRFFLIGSTLQ